MTCFFYSVTYLFCRKKVLIFIKANLARFHAKHGNMLNMLVSSPAMSGNTPSEFMNMRGASYLPDTEDSKTGIYKETWSQWCHHISKLKNPATAPFHSHQGN